MVRNTMNEWKTNSSNISSATQRPDPPAMCQEAAADVARAVTARRGAGHALRLAGLPCELDAV